MNTTITITCGRCGSVFEAGLGGIDAAFTEHEVTCPIPSWWKRLLRRIWLAIWFPAWLDDRLKRHFRELDAMDREHQRQMDELQRKIRGRWS